MKNLVTPLLLCALVACSAPGPTPAASRGSDGADAGAPRPLPDVSPEQVADGNRAFAINLYRHLAEEEDGNIFISPISIATAFGPVTAGSAGETREGIARALGYPASGDTLHPAMARLNAGLERDSEGTRLTIANALWLMEGYDVGAPFLATARDIYAARVEELDFGGDPAGSANTINAWVRERTNDRISSIITARNLDEMTRLVVTNAVYFLGDWASPFNAGVTRPGPFRTDVGRQVSVPMMSQRNGYRIHDGGSFSAIVLPYKDPRISMTILLPHDEDGLAAMESSMTPTFLASTLENLDAAQPGDVQLTMPKFEMENGYRLNDPLIALGMGAAFDRERADFSLINATERLFIHQVLHKTYLRVDEKGTEAAAATAVEVGVESMPISFTIDHPFILMIRDHESGALLFYGRVVNPAGDGLVTQASPTSSRATRNSHRMPPPRIDPRPPSLGGR